VPEQHRGSGFASASRSDLSLRSRSGEIERHAPVRSSNELKQTGASHDIVAKQPLR